MYFPISPKTRFDFSFLCNMKPFLKTGFHVAQTGLTLHVWLRVILTSDFFLLPLPKCWITGMCHHAWYMKPHETLDMSVQEERIMMNTEGYTRCQLDELMSFKNYYYMKLTTHRKLKLKKLLIDWISSVWQTAIYKVSWTWMPSKKA